MPLSAIYIPNVNISSSQNRWDSSQKVGGEIKCGTKSEAPGEALESFKSTVG